MDFGYDVGNSLKDCVYFSVYFYFLQLIHLTDIYWMSNSVLASGNLVVKTTDTKQFTEKLIYTVINLCYNMKSLK